MKTLYEAANAIEAHMLQDLLRQEGIAAHVQGEHLQGAMGELPAAGLVRLLVDEDDHAAARALIDRWEAAQPADTPPRAKTGGSGRARWFVIGLALGLAGMYAAVKTPVSTDGVDHNRDGLLDEEWTYAPSGAAVKMQADRNLDRKVDYIQHHDLRGRPASAEADDDFDGVFETRLRYRDGNTELTETDTDGDRYFELKSYFADGVLQTTETLNPRTGLPLKVEHYKLGRVTHIDVDRDQDGKLDTRIEHTTLGEVGVREPLPAR